MCHPRVRVRREVCILAEDLGWAYVLLELHQEADLAYIYMQRIERLHLVEPCGRDVAFAERRHAQIDKGVTHGRAAEAATVGRPFAAPVCADQFLARRGAH